MENNLSEYSFKEELLNAITHGIGLILSILGIVVLCYQATNHGTLTHIISYSVFGASLVLVYLSSTLYHSFSHTKFRKLFKKFDHLAIYFLIAGTYSPLILVGINNVNGFIVLSIIWILCILSCLMRLSRNSVLQKIAFLNYLIMGWFILVIFEDLANNLPSTSLYLLFTGGFLYTFGVIFYCWEKLPFNHSIWHLFVLSGSASHYFAIYGLL